MLENFNQKENPSEKEKQLENAKQEVEKIKDKIGKKVDPGIKETVAIFRAMGFPTESSCAGHTNELKDEGYGLPYVRIYTPPPEGWVKEKTNKELGEKWRLENLKYKEKLSPFLEEFNKTRISVGDALLHMQNIGVFDAFSVESIGVENTKKLKKEEEIIIKIKQYQEEMKLFTEFLKNKFLNENN